MIKDLCRPFTFPNQYLWAFLLCIPLLIGVFIYAHSPDPAIKTWLDGFTGNLIAGIIQAVMFLFLAFYLDGKTEQKIDAIVSVTKRNERIAQDREAIHEFERFLHTLPYYNVRFPEIIPRPGHLGVEYTLESVRDPNTNLPRKYETDFQSLWIVKVRGPSHPEVRTPADMAEYANSPIKEDTFYFCRFFSGSWYMGDESIILRHRFYMSGYVGPTEHGISANSHMETISDSLAEMELLKEFFLDPEGVRPNGQATSVERYRIYRDQAQNIYLTVNDSLPRAMYETNPPETYDDTGWFFRIEKMIGFATGEKLNRVKAEVLSAIETLNIRIPRVPWHQTDDHRFDPPI